MTVEGRAEASIGGTEWRSMSPGVSRSDGYKTDRRPRSRGVGHAQRAAGRDHQQVVREADIPNENPIGRFSSSASTKEGGPGRSPRPRSLAWSRSARRVARPDATATDGLGAACAGVRRMTARLPSFVVRASDVGRGRCVASSNRRSRPANAGAPTSRQWTNSSRDRSAPRRFSMVLIHVFALVALALTCVGIYGVSSYSVAQRAHEIGVRIALGARPRSVVGLVVRQSVRPAIVGLGPGSVWRCSRIATHREHAVRRWSARSVVAVGGRIVACGRRSRRDVDSGEAGVAGRSCSGSAGRLTGAWGLLRIGSRLCRIAPLIVGVEMSEGDRE